MLSKSLLFLQGRVPNGKCAQDWKNAAGEPDKNYRAQMGQRLMIDYPSFLENVRSMDKILQGLGDDAPSWSIEG